MPAGNRPHDFSFPIPRCYEDVDANSFFPLTGRIYLPAEWFSVTDNLNGSNNDVFSLGFFETAFLYIPDYFIWFNLIRNYHTKKVRSKFLFPAI